MKTVEHLCSEESHLSVVSENNYLQMHVGVLLKYSIHSRIEFAHVWPARK